MKIEVKNVRVNLAFSEETIMFKADVWINGIKSCYAENQGMGGCTNISWYNDIGKSLFYQAEKYLNGLPTKTITYFDKTWEQNQSLENLVDDFIDEYVNKKEKQRFSKKINKDMQKGIIVSKDELRSYSIISWKGKTINDLLTLQGGETVIKNTVDKYQAQGYKVYNTNLPHHILK